MMKYVIPVIFLKMMLNVVPDTKLFQKKCVENYECYND